MNSWIVNVIGLGMFACNPVPSPSPSPLPSISPSPIVSPTPTPSPSPSPSPKPSPTPSPSPTVVASSCTLGPNASLGGFDIFPVGNPWRQDISSAAVDPLSGSYMASVGGTWPLRAEFGSGLYQNDPIGIPYLVINNATPLVPMLSVTYASSSEPGPYPFPLNMPIERPSTVPATDSDRHVIAINCQGNMLYEGYKMFAQSTGWNAGSVAKFNLSSLDGAAGRPLGWTSADAAGLPIFAGLVRADEVFERKLINHAIRFTISRTQSGYVRPATHSASTIFDSTVLPMGARLRLKASVDISKYSAPNQVILTALKKYGMFLADNGGDMFITGAPDPRWDNNDLSAMRAITAANFEVISTGPITKVGAWP